MVIGVAVWNFYLLRAVRINDGKMVKIVEV
jgi:hypothetical protein